MEPVTPTHNLPEYSVKEVAHAIKRTVEDQFPFVRIRGEISGLKLASSGHLYFKLKDDEAAIDGICWKPTLKTLAVKPEEGMEVVCMGRITTYPARSSYQMIVEFIEPSGEGALMALLNKRREKLAAEGLFDAARKKPLPRFPAIIGVVTSPTGAVMQDILHRLEERYPCHVKLWPVAVQGEQASAQITAAIKGFNAMKKDRPDVLIVARGGGSVEDLWAFNEENVVRAAAASAIPLISAVGHETDTTLIDFAADVRAPTPTAAAEIATPVRDELLAALEYQGQLMTGWMTQRIQSHEQRLDDLNYHLPRLPEIVNRHAERLQNITDRLARALPVFWQQKHHQLQALLPSLKPTLLYHSLEFQQRTLNQLTEQLGRSMARMQEKYQQQMESYTRILDTLDHRAILKRGFAIIRNPKGKIITTPERAKQEQILAIHFHEGEVEVSNLQKSKRTKPTSSTEQQGLFD